MLPIIVQDGWVHYVMWGQLVAGPFNAYEAADVWFRIAMFLNPEDSLLYRSAVGNCQPDIAYQAPR